VPDAGSGFLVEDFLQAITTQLDRTQDGMRVKSVNRPLTYAIRDFSLELRVFVDMDAAGQIRFRAAGPNEAGASVVQIGFTTITRAMIEENTVSLNATRSPSLEEIGLVPEERQKLERLGVRNAAELQRLQNSTGGAAASRLTSIPVDRLRQALQQGRPRLNTVGPAPVRPAPPRTPAAPAPATPAPRPLPAVIRLPPGAGRLRLAGENLIGEKGPPIVRLNKRALDVHDADDRQVVLELPPDAASGALEVELGDGEVLTYELSLDQPAESDELDPWAPAGGSP
jgi:hypothetical protein